ncbi:serine protease [Ideonella azotifigens]|uniref:Trypsin-like peptidase domain-containing protein n=1 Tax=Ideonella azotifigens TaxID=513160 RepID=A0ABP3VD98_9BURK|nr:serine protease [Ideonella azotifigens]MCD2344884.1 serine protease [Ideonella azotifigens]
MEKDDAHSTRITEGNPALDTLKCSWRTAKYSDEDGIGPMGSLFEAGDALVAVARLDELGTTILGSGIMVGPGLLLTATHVLDEFPKSGSGPAFLTFLPSGSRAWLPVSTITSSRTSAFDENRSTAYDITLVSCTLNSDAHDQHPLTLAPIHVALPLIGDRLWAFGYCHTHIEDAAAMISPTVSSGLVTAVFPHGRGERMPASCIEVEMETMGGMSGGPVVNAAGQVIGIVSSSLDGGPSYVTLVWDVLRMNIRSALPWLADHGEISLFGAHELGLVKLTGQVKRKRGTKDVVMTMSEQEMLLFIGASDPKLIEQSRAESENRLDREWVEKFEDEWGNDLEDAAERAAMKFLSERKVEFVAECLQTLDIPEHCLKEIREFNVDDNHGPDYPEIIKAERREDGTIGISFSFEMPHVMWELSISAEAYVVHAADYEEYFWNVELDGSFARMQAFQHCYFEMDLTFDSVNELFVNAKITRTGTMRETRNPRRPKAA